MAEWALLFAIVLAGGSFQLFAHYRAHRQRVLRKLKSVEAVSIANAIEGQWVRISGRLAYEETTLQAPFSERECAAFHVNVTPRDRMAREAIDQHESVPFRLVDESGEAYVDVVLPTLILMSDRRYASAILNDPPVRLEIFLAKHGQKVTNWVGLNESLKYREGILEDGEEVTVYGQAFWERNPDRQAGHLKGYRRLAKRLVIRGTDDNPILISDDPSATR